VFRRDLRALRLAGAQRHQASGGELASKDRVAASSGCDYPRAVVSAAARSWALLEQRTARSLSSTLRFPDLRSARAESGVDGRKEVDSSEDAREHV
jgi:hypothetical protein